MFKITLNSVEKGNENHSFNTQASLPFTLYTCRSLDRGGWCGTLISCRLCWSPSTHRHLRLVSVSLGYNCQADFWFCSAPVSISIVKTAPYLKSILPSLYASLIAWISWLLRVARISMRIFSSVPTPWNDNGCLITHPLMVILLGMWGFLSFRIEVFTDTRHRVVNKYRKHVSLQVHFFNSPNRISRKKTYLHGFLQLLCIVLCWSHHQSKDKLCQRPWYFRLQVCDQVLFMGDIRNERWQQWNLEELLPGRQAATELDGGPRPCSISDRLLYS